MAPNEIIATQPDWWGRLMAFGSILVAGSALWFTQQDRFLGSGQPDEDAHTTQMVNQLKQVDEALELMRQQSDDNTQLRQQLTERDQQLDALAIRMESFLTSNTSPPANEETPEDETSTSLADPNNLGELFGEGYTDERTTDGNRIFEERNEADHDGDVVDALFDWLTQTDEEPVAPIPPPTTRESSEDGPQLRIVRVTQKPLTTDYDINVTLENIGQRATIISELSFQPTEILKGIPTTHALKPLGQSTDSELVVTLTEEHNQSQEQGAQGRYVYRLPKPYVIPAKKTIDVRMAILDGQHIGFGLAGTLKLTFNEAETMVIRDMKLAFIGSGEDTFD